MDISTDIHIYGKPDYNIRPSSWLVSLHRFPFRNEQRNKLMLLYLVFIKRLS